MEPGAAGRGPARGLSRRGMGPAARSAQKCRTGAEAINAQLSMMVYFKGFALRCQAIYSWAFHKIYLHAAIESPRAGSRNALAEAGDRPEAVEGLSLRRWRLCPTLRPTSVLLSAASSEP